MARAIRASAVKTQGPAVQLGDKLDKDRDLRLLWRTLCATGRVARCRPVSPVRWVLVRDPDGKRDSQAFFSTDHIIEPADIIALLCPRLADQDEVRRNQG